MLFTEREVSSGVFDSAVSRTQKTRSQNREVKCFELELFHADGGVSYINERAYPVRRGMLVCAKPHSVRRSDFPVRCSFIRIFHASGKTEDVEAVLSDLPDCTYINDADVTEELLSLFARVSFHLVSSSRDAYELMKANSALLEIFSLSMKLCGGRDHTKSQAPISPHVRAVREYIDKHFSADCSLRRLAQAVNLSPNHLHTVFKECMGLTPYEYAMQKRIELAKKLIAVGEKSMLEIALDTGFCSQSHFNKAFKKQTGTTPVGYRKKLWDRY